MTLPNLLDDGTQIAVGNGNDNVFAGVYPQQYELDNDDQAINAVITTGSGTDTIHGFADNATVTGGAGNDSITFEAYKLYVDGGAGNDTISGSISNADEYITLLGGAGNDVISDYASPDIHNNDPASLSGGDGNDTIYANNGGNDTIDGGGGTDVAYIDVPSAYVKDVVTNVETTYEAPPNVMPLGGTYIGTAGSYNNGGNVGTKALDGNLLNYFDAPTATGSYVALDLGKPQSIAAIAYAPRNGFASRMVGGVFQASNTADFSSGVVTLYTVTAAPANAVLTTFYPTVSGTYQYVRYLGPAGSYSDIAEVGFYAPLPTA